MNSTFSSRIKDNYNLIQERIFRAAGHAGRDPASTRLVVVTKTQPVSVIQEAIGAGATLFGENYADEAPEKILALMNYPDVKWHMIGHIQSRKARLVAEKFDLVHSLDSFKLAERLNSACDLIGKKMPVLLELNLANEETKSGWMAAEASQLEYFYSQVELMGDLSSLQITGLMTMPPLSSDLEASRNYFRKLCLIQADLRKRFPSICWDELSMGASADFEVAIQEGATLVRIGQAIFGPRARKQD